jgi:3-oxoacyl-[acyl-carrier protein] reductase
MSDATPPLQGRRILVTGGATGIGAAAVGVLSGAGAGVAATYHQT